MTDQAELQKKLDETLALLANANDQITKLNAKSAEQIAVQKKAKEHAEAAREQAEQAAAEAAAKAGDLDAIRAQHAKEIKKLQDQRDADLAARDARLSELLIDNGIKAALVEHNIAPQFHDFATAYFKAGAKIEGGEALFGDAPLADGIKSFVASDKGKHFVAAPVNTGGNAPGSTGGDTAPMTRAPLNEARFMEMMRTNPVEANKLARSFGPGFEHYTSD